MVISDRSISVGQVLAAQYQFVSRFSNTSIKSTLNNNNNNKSVAHWLHPCPVCTCETDVSCVTNCTATGLKLTILHFHCISTAKAAKERFSVALVLRVTPSWSLYHYRPMPGATCACIVGPGREQARRSWQLAGGVRLSGNHRYARALFELLKSCK